MASDLELYLLSQIPALSVPVTATPTSTATNGTASSGTTETFDAVLGYYQCNLIAGRRYMAICNGVQGNGNPTDVYSIQIRNSGSNSNPTASSTLICQSEWYCPGTGSAGRNVIPLQGSFIAPTTGINTFGMSSLRLLGTGSFTPVAASLSGAVRELFVIYLGTV